MKSAFSLHSRYRSGGWMVAALMFCISVLLLLFLIPDLHQRTLKILKTYITLSSEKQVPTVKQIIEPEWVVNQPLCDDSLPRHGANVFLPDADESRKNTLRSRLFISNEHKFPIVLILTDLLGQKRYQAISVHPGRAAQVMTPVGRYGVLAQVGSSWCNLQVGFRGGVKLVADDTLQVRDGKVAKLRLMSFGKEAKDMVFSFSSGLGVALSDVGIRPEGHGKLDLQRHRGHFYVEGSVNQKALVFLVDTGASAVMLPRSFAKQAGLDLNACKYHTVSTANGLIKACYTTASEIVIQQFIFRNIEVAVADNVVDALLGMNIISQLHVEQQGDVMRISLR